MNRTTQPQPLVRGLLMVPVAPGLLLVSMMLFTNFGWPAKIALAFISLVLTFNLAGYSTCRSIAPSLVKSRRAMSVLSGIPYFVAGTYWSLFTILCFVKEHSMGEFGEAENRIIFWSCGIVLLLSTPALLSVFLVWNRFQGSTEGITLWNDIVVPPGQQFTINPLRENRIRVIKTAWLSRVCPIQFRDQEYKIGISTEGKVNGQPTMWGQIIKEQELREEAADFLLAECRKQARGLNFGEAYTHSPQFETVETTLEKSGAVLKWNGKITLRKA